MNRFTISAVLVAAALADASSNVKRQDGGSVEWGECEFEFPGYPVARECGKLTVPLDYTDDDNQETIDLDLIKIKATKESSMGSMLFNPGGPGQSGLESTVGLAQQLQIISGGYYDIVSFDPRGTGRTIPLDCTNPPADASVEKRSERLFTKNLTEVVEDKWPEFLELADNCSTAIADKGSFYGTAFVARDMVQIVDALEEDGLLRYYGVSYGTLLGWTFAAMFPERVDRMILDANINPHEYWAGYDVESTADTDALFENILKGCFEAGDICPLAEHGDLDTVLEKLNAFFESMAQQPSLSIPEMPGRTASVLELKKLLFKNLYSYQNFPLLANMTNIMINMDSDSTLEDAFKAVSPDEEAPAEAPAETWSRAKDPFNNIGIKCSDSPSRVTDASELKGLLELVEPVSSWVDAIVGDFTSCYLWPFDAAERYEGDFSAKTKHPVLFVNPTFDPITPLVSAKNASATLEGSVVLEHQGHGHGSLSQPSLCTMRYLRDYMVDGTLPEDGTVCEPDLPLYPTLKKEEFPLAYETVWEELVKDAGAISLASAAGGDAAGDGEDGKTAESAETNSAASMSRGLLSGVAGLVAVFLFSV